MVTVLYMYMASCVIEFVMSTVTTYPYLKETDAALVFEPLKQVVCMHVCMCVCVRACVCVPMCIAIPPVVRHFSQ